MVHGVRLRDGRAEWYRNRWVRNESVAAALGETWKGGPVHEGFDFAANTNVIGHAGRTFAIVEAGSRPYELTDELETVGVCDFDGTLPGGYTAHPEARPGHGRAARRVVLLRLGQQGPVLGDRPRGPRPPHRRRRNRRQPDAARHVAHGALRGDLRPAGHVRHRPRGVRQQLPVRVGSRVPGAVGLLPEGGERRRRPLVRRRAVLRLPPAQRVRRRRPRRARRGPPSPHVRPQPSRSGRGPADARSLDGRPRRRQGPRGTARRPGPGVPASRRAAGRPPASVRLQRRRRRRRRRRISTSARTPCSSTTWWPARPRHASSTTARQRSS